MKLMKQFLLITTLTWLSHLSADAISDTLVQRKMPCSFPFCADGANCAKAECSGCPFNCYRTKRPSCPQLSKRCATDCTPESAMEEHECSKCIFFKRPSKCDLGSFRDITKSAFSGEDSKQWNQWMKGPSKPVKHFSSATMVDVDGDSVLDFFTPMHDGNLNLYGSTDRIQLGLTVLQPTSFRQPMYLKDVSSRIIVDDPWEEDAGYSGKTDKHGEIVVDLDNDGILDIFILSGGMRGKDIVHPKSRDNYLLFGGKDVDEDTGEEIIVFRGGRRRALAAGLEGRMGRGRNPYLLDVNGDGLLDIFLGNTRRVDNYLAPGALYINQGNRTWSKDPGMSEFAETMILTDADGDSIVEEVMVIRGMCFPERDDPNSHEVYGPFPDHVKEFCSTRPVGSTAVYKFNHSTQQMEEISPSYSNVSADMAMQPQCCPHGLYFSYDNGCTATSIASADLDGDGRTDHVILYNRRMEFFFSSDRPVGELPIEKKYLGLMKKLPPMCSEAVSIRLVDLDNSGKLDILIMCSNIGTFLIYSQKGDQKNAWTLRKGCNDNGSLGDIVFSSFNISQEDIKDACENTDKGYIPRNMCKEYEADGKVAIPKQKGLTLADINNDGFMDAVVAGYRGYQKFFLFQPSTSTIGNRHLSLRLIGDGIDVNRYGIGATLTLFTSTKSGNNNHMRKQFREISSYQHTTERYGHQDEKIIFGLNKNTYPVKLEIKWPNGFEQTLWLRKFNASMQKLYPSIDVAYTKGLFFKIRNKKVSGSGVSLCLRNMWDGESLWSRVKAVDCAHNDTTGATYFSFNEWGMLVSFIAPGLCLGGHGKNYLMYLNSCERRRPRSNSWHQTRDGYLRWSGSSMVLGLKDAIVGETPMLRKMDDVLAELGEASMTNGLREERKWSLEYVNKNASFF